MPDRTLGTRMFSMSAIIAIGLPGLPGLPSWLTDPYGYIRDKLINLYYGLGDYVEHWIVNPPHPLPGPWLDYIYSNALGLAVYLIGVVGFLTILLMLIFPRYAVRVLYAGLIAALIGGLWPVWFEMGNWLTDAGNEITKSIAVHPAGQGHLLFLPEFKNVLGAIFGLLVLLIEGGFLLIVFFAYEILFILATLIGLPLLALAPLGDGFKRKFEQVVGIVIVTSFLGRLAAVGILSITMLVIEHMPLGDGAFGQVLTLIAGFGLAIYAQYYILKHADRIYGNVTGRTLGTSRVTGSVETRMRNPGRDVDMAQIQHAHINSVTSPPVPSPAALSHSDMPASLGDSAQSAAWARLRRQRDRE